MKKSISTTAVAAVAAGAAVSVGTNGALADQMPGVEPDWFLSLEGGVLFADPAIDKTGGMMGPGSGISIDFNDFDTDFGYRGAAAFGLVGDFGRRVRDARALRAIGEHARQSAGDDANVGIARRVHEASDDRCGSRRPA